MKMQFDYTLATIKGKKENTMDGTSPYLQINFYFNSLHKIYGDKYKVLVRPSSLSPYPIIVGIALS